MASLNGTSSSADTEDDFICILKTNGDDHACSESSFTFVALKENEQANDKPALASHNLLGLEPSITKQRAPHKLQRWMYALAIVNFDIEIGQSIERILPCSAKLTEREKLNVCYLSFPDSNSGCMGDTQFHYRTRVCGSTKSSNTFEVLYKDYNAKCLPTLQADESYLHGFVYFRQVKDHSLRRGYFQKSLVLLTWFPFVPLFSKIVKFLAPQFFEIGYPVLEAFCNDVSNWPHPATNRVLRLPMLGHVLSLSLPHESYALGATSSASSQLSQLSVRKLPTPSLAFKSMLKLSKLKEAIISDLDGGQSDGNHLQLAAQHAQSHSSPNLLDSPVLHVFSDLNVYRAVLPIIAHVQLLWELVLTCEPIAIIAHSPHICSDVVFALVNCVAPLKYGADYRPFFTIHDSEFKEYTSHASSPPPVILGVTNPFFVKTLADWPHIVKINDLELESKVASNTLRKTSTRSLDMKTGLYTRYKPYLHKDREILKKLLKGIDCKRPSEVQNILLRRFLTELTQSFLIPLERYFASLMPLAKNLSPFKRAPILQAFKIEDFINSLEATGPHLTTGIKGDWTGLYRRFLRSPNFVIWYNARMKEANDKLLALHIETLSDASIAAAIDGRPEVEIVDLILKLKRNLSSAQSGQLCLSNQTITQLKANIDAIIEKLPEDSRHLFRKD